MGRRRRRGKAVKRNTAGASREPEEELSQNPHSFVIHRGKVGKYVQELVRDFRQIMEPYTASNVKARPKNVVKDFVHVAGLLQVSHMCLFTKTEMGPYLKVARFPRGPTLTFRVLDYTLARDVRSSLKKQITYEKQFQHHALLIMNAFTGEGRDVKLMASMFQNMFPSINVTRVKLNAIRRCVLLHYDPEKKTVELRHYTIKVVPVGMSRGVKKIVQGKVPNLSRYEDVSEFLAQGGGGQVSESEFEDDETNRVTLPQAVASRGNLSAQQSSVRLVELGPRITMELHKIEEGLLDGEVLYHSRVEKTEAEKALIRRVREKRKKEKDNRKKEQALNVRKKAAAKEDHKSKSLAGMRHNADLPEGFKAGPDSDPSSEEDNDAEWFEKEVGQKPDKDLFQTAHGGGKRHSSSSQPRFLNKRNKFSGRSDEGQSGGRGGSRGRSSGGSRGGGSRGRSDSSRGDGFRGSSRGGGLRGSSGSSRGGGLRGSSRGGSFRGSSGSSRGGGLRGRSESARGGGFRGRSSEGSRGGGGSRGNSRGQSSEGGRHGGGNFDGPKPKRPRKMFNSQGVGPNFDKAKKNKGPRVVAKKGRKKR